MSEKGTLNAKDLKNILYNLINEQAFCDRSGLNWAEDMVKRLDRAIPDAPAKRPASTSKKRKV